MRGRSSTPPRWASPRAGRAIKDMHWGWLMVFGAASFLMAGYCGYLISEAAPRLMVATNKTGLPLAAIGLWMLLALYAAAVWYFGCVAARCHAVLCDRWFK